MGHALLISVLSAGLLCAAVRATIGASRRAVAVRSQSTAVRR